MRFLIYGAGALGQALGCMMAQAGHEVELVLRRRFIDVVSVTGLSVDGVLGEYFVSSGGLGLLETLEAANGNYDYAIITTKSYDTAAAVEHLAALDQRIDTVVSMQNGCGNIEVVQERFGGQQCLGGRVITGFEIREPGRVHISVTADAIHVGSCGCGVTKRAVILAEALSDAGHPCLAVDDINMSLFAKLLYNCALNPLGAILGVHYGALAERAETREIMDTVIDETFTVIRNLGGKLPWEHPDEYRSVFYSTLIPATYNHRASMLQDLENGKRTEVDSLVGYVSATGKRFGIATVACDMLASIIRFKEKQHS